MLKQALEELGFSIKIGLMTQKMRNPLFPLAKDNKDEINFTALNPENDGFLGHFSGHQRFVITAQIPLKKKGVFPVNVQGWDKKIIPTGKTEGNFLVVTKNVVTKNTQDSRYFRTDYNDNHFSVFVVVSGIFQLWEIGVTVQNNVSFLTVQKTREAQMFRTGGKILLKENGVEIYQNWSHLKNFLAEKLKRAKLPRPKETAKPLKFGLKPNEARVIYYTFANNLGHAWIVEDGEIARARVHFSQLPERPRFRYLLPGEVIQFGDKRECLGTDSTTAQYELLDVEVTGGSDARSAN